MNTRYLVGIDEVGRGPLAGPLCIGACAVARENYVALRTIFRCVKESKQLSSEEREAWFAEMKKAEGRGVVRIATAFVGHRAIDTKGMARALRIGICRVLKKLNINPRLCRVLLDGGLKAPAHFANQKTIIGGDEKEKLIALASIAAKVRRDRRMVRLARRFPAYGFDIHKGYGTKLHYERLRLHGVCEIHRTSFIHMRSLADA